MIIYHNADEIKKAFEKGIKIYSDNDNYIVVKDRLNQYLIECTINNYCIGLTWQDNKTLNGKLFYSK